VEHRKTGIEIMGDERLSLAELKEHGKALGYTKILRRLEIAPIVPLATWRGFSTESGVPFRHVEVWYVLAENQVTVFKAGKETAYYTLS
jgi:hypothetical protein